VTVVRTGPLAGAASVVVSSTGGSATAGVDYVALSETASWGEGEGGERTVSLTLIDDDHFEGNRTVELGLGSPVGVSLLSPSSATFTIVEDETPEPPEVTSPTPGSVLAGTTVTFQWTANDVAVTEWWLYVGRTAGGREILDSGSLGAALSRQVNGLPADGSAVHVTLWYREAGVWQQVRFEYTATGPVITSPAPGSVLAGSAVTFQWSANGAAVAEWWLYVGNAAGARDLANSGSLGTALGHTVTGLPTDGRTVHVTLWYRIGTAWRSGAFTYTSANVPGVAFTHGAFSALESAGTGSVTVVRTGPLAGAASVVVSSTGGSATAGVDYVALSETASWGEGEGGERTVSLTLIDDDHFEGNRTVGLGLGSPVGVSLLSPSSATFTIVEDETPEPPEVTSPTPGSVLAGTTVTFQWTANDVAVTEWWLYVGRTAGGREILDSGSLGAALSRQVNGLPADGSAVHVTLWYREAGVWQQVRFEYTATGPVITSPAPGSVLAGSAVTFQWSANGAAVAEWWLYVGNAAGARDLANSGSLGTALGHTVTGLPTDGRTVHVTLWYRIGTAWRSVGFQYQAP
jgi:hypothetical protein